MHIGTVRNQLMRLKNSYNSIKSQYSVFIDKILSMKESLDKIGITDIKKLNDEIRFKYLDIEMGINFSLIIKNNTYYGRINFFRVEKKAYEKAIQIRAAYIDYLGNISNDNLKTFHQSANSEENITDIVQLWLKSFLESDYFLLNES